MPESVVVGMSGGVDSSVAAARLRADGQHVLGVTLQLWTLAGRPAACSDATQQAAQVARQIGVEHIVVNRRQAFLDLVVRPFVDDYLLGRTPNPCPRCNALIKFPALLDVARQVGARSVATGHYARVVTDSRGRVRIGRGRDKDQSYFLYALGPEVLASLLLPLGVCSKVDVRAQARALGLGCASRPDSQDLCFVESGQHHRLVEELAGDRVRAGWIEDRWGKRLGRHTGVHRFTRGQRKGLGIAVGHAVFVTHIDPETATIVVDEASALNTSGLLVSAFHLAAGVELPVRATVQVRFRHAGQEALVCARADAGIAVCFDRPVHAAAIGQSAVAFDGDVVVGGGEIAALVGPSLASCTTRVAR